MKVAQLATDSVLLTPSASAATDARTANLDCQGANYATIRLTLGVEKNTDSTFVDVQLLESNDTDASNFATFNATYNRNVDNTTATIATFHVDLEGRKRYLRLSVTPDTTTNGDVVSSAVASVMKDVISESATMLGPDVVVG